MHPGQRVILHTTDLSATLDNFRTASPAAFAVGAGEYVYVGQDMPFTNVWLEVGTGNSVASRALAVQVWWANAWHDVVDLLDGTATSTSMAQSGRVSWALRWDKGWTPEQRCSLIPGLETFEVYDLHWARLSWSGALAADTTLKYVGQKFAHDGDLATYYPDLRNANLKAAFGAGKVDWKEQTFAASESIVRDLVSRRIIRHRGQLIDWRLFAEPCVHKTAELIYRGMGASHRDDATAAVKAYAVSMNMENFGVDQAGAGRLTARDKRADVTQLKR